MRATSSLGIFVTEYSQIGCGFQAFCSYSKCSVCFILWHLENICYGNKSFVKYVICRYFLSACGLPFYLLNEAFTFPWLFCNCQFVLLNPFIFFHPACQAPLPSGSHEFVLCIYESASFSCVHLFVDFTYKWDYMTFVFLCLTYFT